MNTPEWLITVTTEYSRYVIAIFLVVTLLVGSGATALDQESSLEQFETDSEVAERQVYIDDHFDVGDDTTSVQIFIRDDDVLDRRSFVTSLELQQELRENETVNETLTDDQFGDLASVVATTALRQEEAAEIEARQESLEADREELNETATTLTELLTETRELQGEYDRLNASYERGEIDDETYAAESERLDVALADVRDQARAELTTDQYEAFAPLLDRARALQHDRFVVESEYERGEIDEETRDDRLASIEESFDELYGAVYRDVLGDEFDALEERADRLETDAAALQDPDRERPSIEAQIEQLESMTDSEVKQVVEELLDEDGGRELYAFLPTSYEPGSTQAEARMVIVTQETDEAEAAGGDAPTAIVDSQVAIADAVDRHAGEESFAFGMGIVSDEINRSLADSMLIVLPLAFLFVAFVLTVAYRDVLDIALGLIGIGVVLTWTFGFMGWAGISFNQIMIAVPVLLVGLSIDYAIHLFMRHREYRSDDRPNTEIPPAASTDTRPAMRIVLSGLGIALVWVTATAAIGFLSNVISPLAPLREFGIASAFGITSALLVFCVLIPAAKVELDEILERRGIDRRMRALGTGGGRLGGVLSIGQRAAGRVPWLVIVIALLLTLGGAYGAAQIDTTFQQEDFIADEPSPWMQSLPEPFAPGEYGAKEHLEYVNKQFLRADSQAQILVEGDVTDDRTLERIDRAEDDAAEQDVAVVLSNDEADVRSPISVMETVAAENESFNETYTTADTTGDGVPDRNVKSVYDELFAVAPDRAADVIHRTDDGEYESARMVISVRGDATAGDVADQMDDVATNLEGGDVTATATGQILVFHVIEQKLFQTVIDSLLLTLVVVFAFLMIAYRWMHGSALLGAITLLPIVFAVAWILGTMSLLEIPFNVMTGTITSLTVGLGVAYNIHMAERYVLERKRGYGLAEALRRSVTGTGGALLGSAATTIGSFGVLVFAILPPLQQFGLITGLTITYAFAGSVFLLPSFLTLWTRYLGPQGGFTVDSTAEDGDPTTVADGNGPRSSWESE